MAWKFLPSLAAAAFAAILFRLFSRGGDQARSTEESASGNDGTAGGASSTHTSTEGQEVATSSGYDGTPEGQDQARSTEESASGNDGTTGGASSTHTSTEGQEVATSSGYDGTAEGQDQARSTEESAGGNDGTAGGASSTHTSAEGQKVVKGYDYEVFLSFRGPDTRAGFTDFLYTSLKDAGIHTFRDDEELRVGEKFAPELLQAIKQSKISIPIFSKGYASSPWCLKELVQMLKCQKNGRQKIMPIFYDVAPSEVRYQIEGYAKAFLSHEEKQRYDEKTIHEWKAALSAVGAIKGWDLFNMTNSREEGAFAKTVTKKVSNELRKDYLVVSDNLVSVDDQVEKIMEMIDAQTSETLIVGIYGMGGIGKTTVAKIIYNQLSKDFEHCCFLSNVRETSKLKGIQCLQHQLITDILNMKWSDIRNIDEGIKTIKDRLSNKKVLLLLDDVEEKDHMNAIVGNHDWFGKGSKIIITTRRKDVLIPQVDCTYEVNGMNDHQSLQLFSKHAFRRDSPLDEYINQSKRAIGIAGGLPLAIEVIGSLLSGKNKKMWDATLKMLESIPHDQVQNKLKISYDALDDWQKHMFLDIACFFIGYNKDIMVYFWDESKFPEVALEVLQNMSLIKIEEDNRVWMHDQLRDLGRKMVSQESKKIKKQSRVWNPTVALDLLRRHEGKTKVEALRLHLDQERQYRFTFKDFERISNLRFLQVNSSKEYFCAEERLLWHESPTNLLPIDDFQENPNLLPQLRWLSWPEIPPTFKITNFSMEDVVILDLSRSEITHDWEGWSHMKVMKNLKVMQLVSCPCLERTPGFSANSKLECLFLSACKRLVEIDVSICQLKSLVFLDVSLCDKLQRLPDELGRDLASLKYLNLKRCYSLERLPNTIGNLELLNELNIRGTRIEELPDSIGKLKSLIELNISSTRIKELPDSIGKLKSLIELDISTTRIKELPDSIGQLENLKVVKMSRGAISKIPNALWTIEKLEVIEAQSDNGFDVEIGNCNRSLRILTLMDGRMYVVPRLPESLIILELSELYMDTFPDLSNLANLKELKLRFVRRDSDGEFDGESDGPVEEDPMPLRIGNLSKLETFDLRCPYITIMPADIRSLFPQLKSLKLWCPNLHYLLSLPSSLSKLELYSECLTTLPMDMSSLLPRCKSLQLWCPNLCCLPSLPSSLLELRLCDCKLCCSMVDLSNLKTLSDLEIDDSAISEIRGLDRLENLNQFQFCTLQQVEILPDLSNLNKLRALMISNCGNLVEIQGNFPPSLESFRILKCGSLQKLPDLSSLKGLRTVEIEGCGKLNVVDLSNLKTLSNLEITNSAISEIRGLDRLENLQELWLRELQQVEILPDLSNLNKLRLLDVSCCGNLVEMQGDFPPSLELFGIWECGSLQKLPDLASLKGVKSVVIKGCRKLNVEAIPSLCLEKGVEFKGDETNQREEMTNLDLNLKL